MAALTKIETSFTVTGNFTVDGKLKPIESADGDSIVQFEGKDGTTYEVAVCLRVEKSDGSEHFIVSEKEMAKLGFDHLDYKELCFQRD